MDLSVVAAGSAGAFSGAALVTATHSLYAAARSVDYVVNADIDSASAWGESAIGEPVGQAELVAVAQHRSAPGFVQASELVIDLGSAANARTGNIPFSFTLTNLDGGVLPAGEIDLWVGLGGFVGVIEGDRAPRPCLAMVRPFPPDDCQITGVAVGSASISSAATVRSITATARG